MTGKATIKKGKMYFDENGWAIVKQVARKKHRSPKYIVMQALRRMIKIEAKNG
jgi:predicted transcriptional regulator